MTKYTFQIFEVLRKGQFICSNSPNDEIKILYKILEDDDTFVELYEYFSHINYNLERGNEYFYFSRNEKTIDLERKIEKALDWIDIIDFFNAFNSSFDVGFRFTASEIHSQLNINADLKFKLENLKTIKLEKKNYLERIKKIIEKLEKDNFISLENELSGTYKVLTSFDYLKDLINTINIPESIENEIPE
jgi:hypothetical protein